MKKFKILAPSALLLLMGASSTMLVSAMTASTTISSVVSSVISVSSSGTVNVDAIPSGSGAQTIANDNVSVSTNDPSGYTLQLATSTASTPLTSGANTISASGGTAASPVAMTANSWGYRVDGSAGFGAGPTTSTSNAAIGPLTFAGVPANSTPDTLKTTAGTATNDVTKVWYAVAVNTSQPAGTYTNSVTYTAVAN